MINKAFRFTGLCLVLAVSLLVTCDPFQEDLIQKDKQVIFNPTNQTVFYILPNSSTVIDLKSIVQTTYTNLILNVTIEPQRGDISKLSDFILKYEPHRDFIEGQDRFAYSVSSSNGRMMKTDSIFIVMGQDATEFPCSLLAIEDFVSIKPGSSVAISFLDNDQICGVEKKDLFKSIYLEPKHGTATLTGNVMSYTSNAGYEGWDQFVYKISGDSAISLGLFSILLSNQPCNFTLHDDTAQYSVNLLTTTSFTIDVLSNDDICSLDSLESQVSIAQKPKHGVAFPVTGGKIRYEMSSSPQESYSDSLVYQLCYKGVCSQAMVKLFFCYLPKEISYKLDLIDDTDDPTIFIPNYNTHGYEIPWFDILNSYCDFLGTFGFSGIQQTSNSGFVGWDESGQFAYFPNPDLPPKNDTAKLNLTWNGANTVLSIYVRREITEHSSDLYMHLESDLDNCVARIGYFLRKETSPGNYDETIAAQGPGCSLHADEYRFNSLPDGKYSFLYDVIWESVQPTQGSDFTITWTSSNGTSVFYGHDTGDPLGGPKLAQYFEKQGSSIFIRSDIKTEWPSPIDVDVSLTWDSGEGNSGDVNLDLHLYQFKPSAAWDVGGAVGMYLLKAAESPGSTFETISTNLGSDDIYLFVVDYISGTSDNVTFTLTISTDSGSINSTENEFSLSGSLARANIGRSSCIDRSGPCNSVLSFRKSGTNLKPE